MFQLPFPSSFLLLMVVVVANKEDARAIYKDRADVRPPAMYKAVDVFISDPNSVSISGKLGDSWYCHRRKGVNPTFAPKVVKRMNQVALEKANQ